MRAIDQLISCLAEPSGVVRRDHLRAAGISREALCCRLMDGRLTEAHPGIFVIGTWPTGWLRRLQVAVASVPGAVVSHRSAATLLALPKAMAAPPVEITADHRAVHRIAGITIHRSMDLIPDRCIVIEGMPVTDSVRTLVDLAAVQPGQIGALVDAALAAEVVSLDDLQQELDRVARQGRTGVRAMRHALESARVIGDRIARTESELERELLRVLATAGLTMPVAQFVPPWAGGSVSRVDFAYPEARIIIEVDGRQHHFTEDAFERDRRRDQLAGASGWLVLRFTHRQVTGAPASVADTVARALARSAGDPRLNE